MTSRVHSLARSRRLLTVILPALGTVALLAYVGANESEKGQISADATLSQNAICKVLELSGPCRGELRVLVSAPDRRVPKFKPKGGTDVAKPVTEAPSTQGADPDTGPTVQPEPADPPGGDGGSGDDGSGGNSAPPPPDPPDPPATDPPSDPPSPPAEPSQPSLGDSVGSVVDEVTAPVCGAVKVPIACP